MDNSYYFVKIHMTIGPNELLLPLCVKGDTIWDVNEVLRKFTAALEQDRVIQILYSEQPYPVTDSFQPTFDRLMALHLNGTTKYTMILKSATMEIKTAGDFNVTYLRKGSFAKEIELKEYEVDFLSKEPLHTSIKLPITLALNVGTNR